MPGKQGGRHGAGGQERDPPSLIIQDQGGVTQAQEERGLTGVTRAGDGVGGEWDAGDEQTVQTISCAVVHTGVGPGRLSEFLRARRYLDCEQLVRLEETEAAVHGSALCPDGAEDL